MWRQERQQRESPSALPWRSREKSSPFPRKNGTASLTVLGGIAVKQVDVQFVDREMVIPCGYPFGIKMFTEGVVVVGLTDVEENGIFRNPAQEAGIRVGDVLTELDGQTVSLNEDVAAIIASSGGREISYTLKRKDQTLTGTLQPIRADSGEYKAGIWVRDSSAGIGTMTYYDPSTMIFAGLGHAVCDVDTGETLPLGKGEIVDVTITSVEKGISGQPGSLQGSFEGSRLAGFMAVNSETGVYGQLTSLPVSTLKPVPIAMKQEVREGAAQIYTTISGCTPQCYDIVIESVNLSSTAKTKSMVIRVTDPELLEATGGILQGMSGSPILQDGKLVGAVTHVFVNDQTRGYGIFAENMQELPRVLRSVPQPDQSDPEGDFPLRMLHKIRISILTSEEKPPVREREIRESGTSASRDTGIRRWQNSGIPQMLSGRRGQVLSALPG